MERLAPARALPAPARAGLALSLQILRTAQGPQGRKAANEAWSRRFHAAGEVLPAAAGKEAQGQKALSVG